MNQDQASISTIPQKDPISYDDFSRMDFRIGTVTEAVAPDWSRKLLRFTVDFGDLGKRTIFSGIQKWYAPEDFIGKQFCFLINLEAKKMGGEQSQGMMIMADTIDGNVGNAEKPTLMPLNSEVQNGTVVR